MQLFCSLHPASFHNAFWQFPGAVYPDFCIFRTAVMQFFASASVTVQHEMRLQSSRFFILHACRRILFAILWHGKAPPAISRPKFHVIDAQSAPFCNPCRALPQNALQIPSRKYAKKPQRPHTQGCCGHCVTFFFGICLDRHTLDYRKFCCPIPA